MSKNNQSKGVSIYLSLMIMAVLLSIALGVSTIFIAQVKMIKEMGNSVIALYAADTGIEKVLVDRGNPDLNPDYYSGSLSNGAAFKVTVAQGGTGNCTATNYCIKSIGLYRETKRAIEIAY